MSVLTPAAFFFLPKARGSLPTLSLSLILTKRKPLGLLSLLYGYHYEGRRQRAGLEHQELWWVTAVRGEIVFWGQNNSERSWVADAWDADA